MGRATTLVDERVRAEVLAQQAASTRLEAIALADRGLLDDALATVDRMADVLERAGLDVEADALRTDAEELHRYDRLARKRLMFSKQGINRRER